MVMSGTLLTLFQSHWEQREREGVRGKEGERGGEGEGRWFYSNLSASVDVVVL